MVDGQILALCMLLSIVFVLGNMGHYRMCNWIAVGSFSIGFALALLEPKHWTWITEQTYFYITIGMLLLSVAATCFDMLFFRNRGEGRER